MQYPHLCIALLGLGLSACGGGSGDSGPVAPIETQFELQVKISGNPGPVQFQWQGQPYSVSADQTLRTRQGSTLTEPSGYVMPAGQSCEILYTKLSSLTASLQLTCHVLQQYTLQLEATGNPTPLTFRWLGQPYQLNQQLTLTQHAERYEAPSDWAFPPNHQCQSTQTQDTAHSYRIHWICAPGQLSLKLPQPLPYTASLKHRNKIIQVQAATTLLLDNTEPAGTLELMGSAGPQHCALQAQNPQLWQLQCQEFALVYGRATPQHTAALQLLQADGKTVELDTQPAPDTGLLSVDQQLYYLQADGLRQLNATNGRYDRSTLLVADAIGMALAERPTASSQLLALTAKTLYRLEQGQFVRLRDTPGTPFQAPLYGGLDRVSWLSQPEPDKPLSLWQRVASEQNRFASAPAGRRSAATGAVLSPDPLDLSTGGTTEQLIWPSWDNQELVLDYLASSKVEMTRLPASQSPTLWQTAPHTWLITRLSNGQIEQFRYNKTQGFFWQSVQPSNANWLAGSEQILAAGQMTDGMVTLTTLLRYPADPLLGALQQASHSNQPFELAAARTGRSGETGLAPKLARAGWLLLYQAGTVWLSNGTLLFRLSDQVSREHYQQWQLLSVGNTLAVVRDHQQLLLPVPLR